MTSYNYVIGATIMVLKKAPIVFIQKSILVVGKMFRGVFTMID